MPLFLPIESRLKRKGFDLIAGLDEAGRGPLAGPLVAAAVILPANNDLRGLNDSKKLTANQRVRLFNEILEQAIDYAIAVVAPEIIDQVNIVGAVRIANDLCIRALKNMPDIALIDGCDKQILTVPFLTMIEGDSRIRSIAAASILAKVVRDAIMRHYAREFPHYGFERHKGYGTRLHRSTLTKFGPCAIHRKSYTFSV